ncbi:MAG: flavin reductase family protein [Desulfurococcaceae archaeon]|jgi:flavin reductase (DIM6/NTAB) family NADH-FMN oxidoreductase RutF
MDGVYVYRTIDPRDYHVLHPRPVYLIVARSSSGKLNVMSASWVTPVSDEPFLVALSIWTGSFTYQLIRETGEFTINVPSENHVNVVYKAGTMSGREVDKLSLLGLKTVNSTRIQTPGLADMLGFLECKVVKEIALDDTALFIAEVLAVHVREDVYTRYGWDLAKGGKVLLHLGGRGFTLPYRLILASKS